MRRKRLFKGFFQCQCRDTQSDLLERSTLQLVVGQGGMASDGQEQAMQVLELR